MISNNKKKGIESSIIVAVIALLGTFTGYIFDSINKTKQQQREFESSLIIKAVETGNSEISRNNLKFLMDANLISDKSQQIKLQEIIKDSTYKIYKGSLAKSSYNNKVYICTKKEASKYHFSRDCRGLDKCDLKILEVTEDIAKEKYNRVLCGWED
jgi:hypothetical protein